MRRAALLVPACFTLAAACTVKEAGSAAPECNGPDCQDAGIVPPFEDEVAPAPAPTATTSAPVSNDAGAVVPEIDAGHTVLYPVCEGLCLPDDGQACADFDPDDELDVRALYSDSSSRLFSLRALMSTGADAGAGQDASADTEEAGRVAVDEANQGNVSGDSGSSDGVLEAEAADVDAAAEAMGWSCQVDRDNGDVAVGCWLSGGNVNGDPCTSTRDCQPGYACTRDCQPGYACEKAPASCRKFCCNGDDACSELNGTPSERYFCDERPLVSANVEGADLNVPVCARAAMCDLAEPSTCEGADCACQNGETCTIVNQEGLTDCRFPGEGGLEEACPCQAGFYCHPVEQTCKQVCNLERDDGVCGESLCQATANFPLGWGLCQPVAPATE